MAENNSKTFIIGIVVFILLVIGGFAFFAKKDVAVDQTQAEMTAAPEGATVEITPAAPAPAPTPIPTPADEVTPTAPGPANTVDVVPAPTPAPATESTPAPAE